MESSSIDVVIDVVVITASYDSYDVKFSPQNGDRNLLSISYVHLNMFSEEQLDAVIVASCF